MPGSGETSPNPIFCAMPTQPDHTSAAAGAARTSSGQDRTVLVPEETAVDRSPRLVRRSGQRADHLVPDPRWRRGGLRPR